MRRLFFYLLLLVSACGSADHQDTATSAEGTQVYYVTADTIEERSEPSADATILNRLYRGQRLEVYAEENGWVRTTQPEYEARWVPLANLSSDEPSPADLSVVTARRDDPRIAPNAIRSVGENGLTAEDVDIMWRGAFHMLDSGTCAKVEYSDKSVSKPDTYFVNCGGPNLFFTPDDLPAR